MDNYDNNIYEPDRDEEPLPEEDRPEAIEMTPEEQQAMPLQEPLPQQEFYPDGAAYPDGVVYPDGEAYPEAQAMPEAQQEPVQRSPLRKGLFYSLLIVMLFVLGNLIGSLTNITRINNFTPPATTTTLPLNTSDIIDAGQSVTAQTEETTTKETTTEEATTKETTTKETTTQKPTTTQTTTAPQVPVEEVLDLFNSGANRVKNKAVKIIREYEKLTYDERGSLYPENLKGIAEGIVGGIVKEDTEAEEYIKRNDMIDNYPVSGEKWSSKLKVSDIKRATLKEKDGVCTIELYLKDCRDPGEGTGVAAAFDTIDGETVADLVPTVKSCNVGYSDCSIVCDIDTETGDILAITYHLPMTLDITVGIFSEAPMRVAMTAETRYKIEY